MNLWWGTSLSVQWLGPHALKAWNVGSVPGQRTKTQHATWQGQKLKLKKQINLMVALSPQRCVFHCSGIYQQQGI